MFIKTNHGHNEKLRTIRTYTEIESRIVQNPAHLKVRLGNYLMHAICKWHSM